MDVISFEDTFPALMDVETAQVYDTSEGAAEALETIKSSISAEDGKPLSHDSILDLITLLDRAVLALVTKVMPSEDATARTAYVLEDASHMRVSLERQLARLRSQETSDSVAFRVTNMTLEQTFQALLDHVTADRVAEEMDAPTYVERLRGGFKRARDGAATLKRDFDVQVTIAKRIENRLRIARDIAVFLQGEIKDHALQDALDAIAIFSSNSHSFATHFNTFTSTSRQSLNRIEVDICSDANVAGAEWESVLVSRELERRALFRPLPIFWSLVVAFLVKIVLAYNTAEVLHYQAVSILIVAFVLTWGFSIYIGVSTRSQRMRHLQRHLRRQFRQALRDDKDKEELIAFPSVGAEATLVTDDPIKAYPYRGRAFGHKSRVARRNLWALAIPAVLLALVLATRKEGDFAFVARFQGAEPCLLSEGRLVFATRNYYFVSSDDAADGPLEKAVSRVFPELLAHVIRREDIISVKPSGVSLHDCSTRDPGFNAHNVIHSGNALGVWGQQQSVDAMFQQGNDLITALATSSPTHINVDAAPIVTLPDSVLAVFEGGANVLTERLSLMIDRQEQLIATTNAGQDSDSIAVTPIILDLPERSDAGPITTQTNIFQTAITIAGQDGPLDTLGNTLVLPFFTAPVRDGAGGLINPQSAFEWGSNPNRLEDPKVLDDGTTYFARIAQTLVSCLAQDATVTIDILGLASRSWDGPTDSYPDAELNYHLAEGRRIGALLKLSEFITSSTARDRLMVQRSDGTYASLSSIMAIVAEQSKAGDLLGAVGRFDGVSGFEARRDTLLAVTGLNPDVESPLEELFARSVVLRMVSTSGGPCEF